MLLYVPATVNASVHLTSTKSLHNYIMMHTFALYHNRYIITYQSNTHCVYLPL